MPARSVLGPALSVIAPVENAEDPPPLYKTLDVTSAPFSVIVRLLASRPSTACHEIVTASDALVYVPPAGRMATTGAMPTAGSQPAASGRQAVAARASPAPNTGRRTSARLTNPTELRRRRAKRGVAITMASWSGSGLAETRPGAGPMKMAAPEGGHAACRLRESHNSLQLRQLLETAVSRFAPVRANGMRIRANRCERGRAGPARDGRQIARECMQTAANAGKRGRRSMNACDRMRMRANACECVRMHANGRPSIRPSGFGAQHRPHVQPEAAVAAARPPRAAGAPLYSRAPLRVVRGCSAVPFAASAPAAGVEIPRRRMRR